ncbi:glycosyl transferase [Pelagibacterium lentulum]|uniref:Glycosyl transferase n=2 Tax=Pelagibacterium lentulum TaxID=2029865 RepID=A0A916VVF1_9HYPH|nr:glycosyl transferase [Pelagibacterium lentulum]
MVNFRGPLIQDIVARGHDVYALAPDYDESIAQKMKQLGASPVDYSLSRAGLNPFVDFSDSLKLRRKLREIAPDTILSFGIKPVIYGTIAAWAACIPHRYALITGLGYAFTTGAESRLKRKIVGALARFLYRISLGLTRRTFVQNPDDFKDLVAMRVAPASKMLVVNGTGVDLDEWRPAPPVTAPLTFTLAARLLRDKGVVEFVEAARKIKAEQGDSVRFILVGDTDSNPESIDRATLDGWVRDGIIEWPGHVDMKEYLAKTSVYVLPSYREGVPRSTQEAMAMARPVITTDAPGCRETVVEGRNGFLVPPRDAEALAAAMRRFIDRPDLIALMGVESRKLVEERFDVRMVNATMIAEIGL